MTRQQIIKEMASAATACYNHYSDTPLTQTRIDAMQTWIGSTLPSTVYTSHYAAKHAYNELMDSTCEN